MADVVETSEARWFKIVVFVVSGFFVGFSLANIIYFNRIRRNNGVPGITRGEATSMLWINAILFAISLIIFIWAIFRLVAGREYRQRIVQYFNEPGEGFIEPASQQGVPVPRVRRTTRTTVQQENVSPAVTTTTTTRRAARRVQGNIVPR
jgi:hypothetical protein